MRMNIFRQEFRMHLRSAIAWALSIAVVILLFGSLYPGFARDAELLNQAMAKFPKPLLDAFGMSGIDLSTVLGFYSLVFLFVQICLAIQASNYGFSLVSIEEREWTADFLLAKPVGRSQILSSKLLAALCALIITNLVTWISSFAFVSLFRGERSYETRPLLLLLASIIVFQLFFLSVGLVISLLVKRIRNVTPYGMGLGFGMYLLSAFSDMLGESALEKITPFKHFDASSIIEHGAYDAGLVLISVLVIVISLVGSYLLYTRRDIPSAV